MPRWRAPAETQALQWSFRVARGRVAAELLAAAPEADMMVLGKTSLSGKGRGARGSAARAFAASTSGAVLYSDHRPGAAPHEASVVVVYDDGPAADHALEVAARVASRDAGALNVLLPGRAGDASDGLRERVAVALAPSGLDICLRPMLGHRLRAADTSFGKAARQPTGHWRGFTDARR